MAYAVVSQSSLTLSGSFQTVGATVTTGRLAICELDLTNMVAGDKVEIAAYSKTCSTDAEILVFDQQLYDGQMCDAFQTPVLWAPYSITFKAKQTAGTARSVPFVVFTID